MKLKTWGEVLHMRSESPEVGEHEANSDTDTNDTERDREHRDNIVHTVFMCAASFACVSESLRQLSSTVRFCHKSRLVATVLWQDSPKMKLVQSPRFLNFDSMPSSSDDVI